MTCRLRILVVCALACGALLRADGFPREWLLNAHNCYPDRGRGAGRLKRARKAGLSAIEIDLAWSETRGRSVISHETELTGKEPTLQEYFLAPLLPALRRMPSGQPGMLLFLDFKIDHPALVKEIYDLLGRHGELLTTFGRGGGPPEFGPLTVMLTGDNVAIARFESLTGPDEPYRAMGNREPPGGKFQEDVNNYFPLPATAFYRVFNFEWKHIERDPNFRAGAFTPAERARLQALVKLAHRKGYWVRAWTLNATSNAWGSEQNFGSKEALLERWRAALDCGVEMIATDEYETAGAFLRPSVSARLRTRQSRR